MNKKNQGFIFLGVMFVYSLCVFFKRLENPNDWRFYAAAAGLAFFSFLLGLRLKSLLKKTDNA